MAESPRDNPKASLRLPLIVGLGLAIGGGSAGYLAVESGRLPFLVQSSAQETDPPDPAYALALEDTAFVPIAPIMVNVAGRASAGNLRFEGNLEVDSESQSSVSRAMPRIVDVLNGYLRAVELNDLRDPAALVRLRAQMLRRVQTVTGPGQVRDLLVTQFILT